MCSMRNKDQRKRYGSNRLSKKQGVKKVVRYIVTKENTSGKEQYGITVIEDEEEEDSIADIAPSFEETALLAAFLQENGVAAVHFRDVVEDYLAK